MKNFTKRVIGLISALVVAMSAICSAKAADEIPRYIRRNAVLATIAAAKECKRIPQFYWEIGDAETRLASGMKGSQFNADTSVNLASASKWIFATYVLEKYRTLTDEQIKMLTLRSGYRTFLDQLCIPTKTVNECMRAPLPYFAFNNLYTSENIGTFFYSGAHYQQLAIDLGLGDYTASMLSSEVQKYLGVRGLNFTFPGIGSGMNASARNVARVMRKMMRKEFLMGDMLGSNRICTLPASCPESLRSPLKTDWDYSLGHWVEHEPGGADEAYSGPGLQGFYPWISADKTLYGVLSTQVFADFKASSSACGGKIRKAWISGVMVQ